MTEFKASHKIAAIGLLLTSAVVVYFVVCGMPDFGLKTSEEPQQQREPQPQPQEAIVTSSVSESPTSNSPSTTETPTATQTTTTTTTPTTTAPQTVSVESPVATSASTPLAVQDLDASSQSQEPQVTGSSESPVKVEASTPEESTPGPTFASSPSPTQAAPTQPTSTTSQSSESLPGTASASPSQPTSELQETSSSAPVETASVALNVQQNPPNAHDIDATQLLEFPDRTNDELSAWRSFKQTYGKLYPNPLEQLRRQAIFIKNLRLIKDSNSDGRALYKLGVNHFADLQPEEINRQLIGPTQNLNETLARLKVQIPMAITILPESLNATSRAVDWRANLPAVIDQRSCLDSAVFAAVANIEAALNSQLVAHGLPLVKLSEQQVIDCMASAMHMPCAGRSSLIEIFELLQRQAVDLVSYEDFEAFRQQQPAPPPATQAARVPLCKLPPVVPARARLANFMLVNRENIPDAVLNSGPLGVMLDASQFSFHFYSSGLYHNDACQADLYNLHALLVGYDEKVNSYTLRASLGNDWGESGYMRLLKDEQRNKCQPQQFAVYPNLMAT